MVYKMAAGRDAGVSLEGDFLLAEQASFWWLLIGATSSEHWADGPYQLLLPVSGNARNQMAYTAAGAWQVA